MEGYDVKLTDDGAQALDDTQAFLPDLIVLDLGLPAWTASRSRASCAATRTTRRS
jgi:DNA-binding response OmpR family regulator